MNQITTPVSTIATLAEDAKLKDVIAKVNELVAIANQQKSKTIQKGERAMTEDDAKRIMLGDLKDKSHNEVSKLLGLSYGQVYSARKGFTFKTIYQEMLKANTKTEVKA